MDDDGQPTNRIIETRRRSDLITPVPKPKKRRQNQKQASLILGGGDDLSTEDGRIAVKVINHLGDEVMKVFGGVMAVLCEAISVVVRADCALAAFGSFEAFKRIVPNQTLVSDNELMPKSASWCRQT